MSQVYDLIIIGAGPAGMTAGVYAARKKLQTLIISKDIGGQITWSNDTENYLGFSMITGSELAKKFEDHLEEFKDSIELRVVGVGVKKIIKSGDNFQVGFGDGGKELARAVIIAGGKVPQKLGVRGEDIFLNRGVSYCAWCDGSLFKTRDVAIVGSGDLALDAALNVAKLANQVYIINISPELTGNPAMIKRAYTSLNVRVMNNTEVTEIKGEKFVQSIRIKSEEGLQKDFPVSGVFIEIGSLPATDYLEGLLGLNEVGEIVIDRYNATSIKGIFAAGDITNIVEKQVATAVGEGAKAAIQASRYLARQQ